MQNIYGNKAVVGENFYGRSKFVKLLKDILISQNSFLLLGLRRLGKSSTVKEALRLVRKEAPEIIVIELNCQTYKSLKDFYKELFQALPQDWRLKLRKALQDGKRLPTKIIDFISDHIEEVDMANVGSLKLRNSIIDYANPIKEEVTKFFEEQKEHIVLSIDELPFLFEAISRSGNETAILEIESILTTLRDWRNVGVSEAITGSINLHVQLTELGISKKLLAGLNSQQLSKFTIDEATGLLHALADSQMVPMTPGQIETMVEVIPDFIPQFLQYYFFIVKSNFEENDTDVKKLYDEYVYPVIVSDFEYQFEDRLSSLSPDDLKTARLILNHIKINGVSRQKDILVAIKEDNSYAVLIKLLDFEILEMDVDQNCDFALNIIKNWWNKK